METDESIKISLSFGVAKKALELLLDGLRSIDFNDIPRHSVRDINYIEGLAIKADEILGMADSDIRELEGQQLDETDESKIDDMICKIESMIEGGIYAKPAIPNQPALDELADEIFKPKVVDNLVVDPTIAKISKAVGLR